jgi:hypothetical protein
LITEPITREPLRTLARKSDSPAVLPATLFVCLIILILRKTDSVANPQLIAEDGPVFFMGAYVQGLAAFITPSAGYLHTVPRIIAWIAGHFDPLIIPAIYNYSSLLIHLGVIAAIFSGRISLPVKPLFALLLVLVPHTGEIFIHLTNLQWILAAAILLLLLSNDAETRPQIACDIFILTACGLTGPFLIILLPLFFIRLYFRRSRYSLLLTAAALFPSLIQTWFMVNNYTTDASAGSFKPLTLATIICGRLFTALFSAHLIRYFHTSYIWIGTGIIGTVATLLLGFRKGPYRTTRIMLSCAIFLLAIPVAVKFARHHLILSFMLNGDRYFFMPHLLLLWLLLLSAYENRSKARYAFSALLAASIIISFPSMKSPPAKDLQWKDHVDAIRNHEPFDIPINPDGCRISYPGRNQSAD